MLDSRRKGYAVMSPDFKGISLEDESLDTCKRYCYNGDVIVTATPVKCGFSLRVYFHKQNPLFKITKYDKVFFKCRFYFDWVYCHKYGTEVLYTNPYDYSESIKRGLIS